MNSTDAECPPAYSVRGFEYQHVAGYLAIDQVTNCYKNGTALPDKRWWLWVAHVEMDNQNRTWTSGTSNTTTYYRSGKSSVSIIACQPKIEMRKARVVSDGRTMNASLIPDSSSPVTINLTAWDLLTYAQNSEQDAKFILGGTNRRPWPQSQNTTLTEMIFVLMNATMPRKDSSGWMDTDFLMESSKKAFQNVASQVVFDHFTNPANATLTGSASWLEQRLILRSLSFYLVASLLVVLLGIAAALCFYQPIIAVPRDPGSIAGLAAILASSPSVIHMLKGVGHSAVATKAQLIAGAPFHSETVNSPEGRRFRIQASNIDAQSSKPFQHMPIQKQQW